MRANIQELDHRSSRRSTTRGLPDPMRTADELQATARELRQMARTAATTETRTAVLTLAQRYEVVARQLLDDPTPDSTVRD